MHKLFLTQPECSIIDGAEEIIHQIGGFPSMEDGELKSVLIEQIDYPSRYCISFLFDIQGWYEVGKYYGKVQKPTFRYIRLNIDGAVDVFIRDGWRNGEIKFLPFVDREQMRQDDLPSSTPIFFC